MANISAIRKTNIGKTRHGTTMPKTNYLFITLATFAGVAFGVLLSLGLMGPMLHQQVASATKDLSKQVAQMTPASSYLPYDGPTQPTACTAPSGGSGGGGASLQTAARTTTSSQPGSGAGGGSTTGGRGGGNGGNGGTKNVWVHKFVSGVFAKTNATISDTGKGSTNSITTTNTNTTTVWNHNDVEMTNNNPQTAVSGNAKADANTHGGSATTGTAKNDSDASFSVNITN